MADARMRHHEQTRAEIVAAAWKQAEAVGVAAISLRDLAADVGMRAPSLYTYFASKDAIYDAMFAEGYEALTADIELIRDRSSGLDRLTRLTKAAEGFIVFCQASAPRYQLMFTRAIPGWEPSPDAYAVSVASYGRSAEALAEAGIADDGARDLYVAMVAGLAAQQMANEPAGDRWRRLASDAMHMLVEHLECTEKGRK